MSWKRMDREAATAKLGHVGIPIDAAVSTVYVQDEGDFITWVLPV